MFERIQKKLKCLISQLTELKYINFLWWHHGYSIRGNKVYKTSLALALVTKNSTTMNIVRFYWLVMKMGITFFFQTRCLGPLYFYPMERWGQAGKGSAARVTCVFESLGLFLPTDLGFSCTIEPNSGLMRGKKCLWEQ